MNASDEALAKRARSLRLLLFDVDGVLTDGTLLIDSAGSDTKPFFIKDGAALTWAPREGLDVGILSGRRSMAVSRRAEELGITLVMQGKVDKREAYEEILRTKGLGDAEVAYMGDDLLDLTVLTRVGLSAAPADAAPDVRSRVHWVSQHPGGRGAVREFIELLLRLRGRWDAVVQGYLT